MFGYNDISNDKERCSVTEFPIPFLGSVFEFILFIAVYSIGDRNNSHTTPHNRTFEIQVHFRVRDATHR